MPHIPRDPRSVEHVYRDTTCTQRLDPPRSQRNSNPRINLLSFLVIIVWLTAVIAYILTK